MIRSKFVKAFTLGMCISVFSAGAAFAASPEELQGQGQSSVAFENYAPSDVPSDLLAKQAEIDKYVFDTHASEIVEKGIFVTYTSPADGYVEMGITPYTEENINYLYDIFGTEAVKIAKGVDAILFQSDVAIPDEVATDSDLGVTGDDIMTITGDGSTAPKNETMELARATESEKTSSPIIYALGGAVLLGGTVLTGRYVYANKKS